MHALPVRTLIDNTYQHGSSTLLNLSSTSQYIHVQFVLICSVAVKGIKTIKTFILIVFFIKGVLNLLVEEQVLAGVSGSLQCLLFFIQPSINVLQIISHYVFHCRVIFYNIVSCSALPCCHSCNIFQITVRLKSACIFWICT